MRRGSNGTPRQLVQVYNGGSMPSATGKFFATHPVTITGDECEGCPATITADTSFTYYVLFIGSRVPQVGDVYVARFLDYRWVAESGGKCTWTLYVYGCNSTAVSGATVTLKQSGSTVATQTASSGGQCVFSVPPGIYDVQIDPPAGTGLASTTETGQNFATCGQSNNYTLSTDGSHTCIGCVPCSVIPTTLTLSFNYYALDGTLTPFSETLTYNGSGGWVGSCFTASCGGFVVAMRVDNTVGRPSGCPAFPGSSNVFDGGTCSPFHLYPTSGGNPFDAFLDG